MSPLGVTLVWEALVLVLVLVLYYARLHTDALDRHRTVLECQAWETLTLLLVSTFIFLVDQR